MGLKALGFDELADAVSDDEEMGNIIITGDINSGDPKSVIEALNGLQQKERSDPTPQPQKQQEVTQQPQPQPQPQKGNDAAKLLMASAALVGASGLPIAAYNLTRPTTQIVQPTTPVVDTDTDTKYGLRIYREDSTD